MLVDNSDGSAFDGSTIDGYLVTRHHDFSVDLESNVACWRCIVGFVESYFSQIAFYYTPLRSPILQLKLITL